MYGQQEGISYMSLQRLAKINYGMKKVEDKALNILPAGRITAASFLSFLFYVLARRPDVFRNS